MADETPFIRIGNREIYDALRRLEGTVASLDSRINTVLNENAQLGKRVRGLELRFYGVLAGLIAALAVLLKVGGIAP